MASGEWRENNPEVKEVEEAKEVKENKLREAEEIRGSRRVRSSLMGGSNILLRAAYPIHLAARLNRIFSQKASFRASWMERGPPIW